MRAVLPLVKPPPVMDEWESVLSFCVGNADGLRFSPTLALKSAPAPFPGKFELKLSSGISLLVALNKVFLASLNLHGVTFALAMFTHYRFPISLFSFFLSLAIYTSIYTYHRASRMEVIKICAFC